MQGNELNGVQIRKGIVITVVFVVLRIIAARLWDLWFEGQYHLTIPFLLFLLVVFVVMSVGLVYLGFSKCVGVNLKAWWFRREHALGDVVWAVVTLISVGVLVVGVGIAMWVFDLMPPSLETYQETMPLAQVPVSLVLGWLFGFAVAAFEEESIFRGFWQAMLSRRYGEWKGNLIQAALFSAAHLGMESLASVEHAVFLLLFRFGFGVLLGWLRMKRSTLLAAGIVHGFIG